MERRGFTIIETMVSIVIVTFVIVAAITGVLSVATAEKRSEKTIEAKDIANYVLDYIRSRNVTFDNPMGFDSSLFGNDENHPLPGLIDANGNPLSINTSPATPNQKFSNKPEAFYFSLQGVVSLGENGYIIDSNTSPEDANLYISNGKYFTLITNAPLLVRFPLNSTINGQDNPSKIVLFSAGGNYIPKIFRNGNAFTTPSNPNYSPYFTNNTLVKDKTTDYTGYRVLTKVVARKQKSSDPDHVQWFDVEITVYWKEGLNEKEYSIKAKLTSYGEGL